MGKVESILRKLGLTLVLLVFAIIFSWVGLSNGAIPLFGMVSQWYQARSYTPVEASVISTTLTITTGETRTERVKANFAYRYGDRRYFSDKVSSSPLADNFDPYHRTVHARLLRAKEAGQTVTIWVDPAHPANALYDRGFRTKPALFMLPSSLFAAVGLGAWWGIWFVWWGKRDAEHEFRPGELRRRSSGDRYAPLAITLVALFYNILSWPTTLLSVLNAPANSSFTSKLILLFPLIGLGLVYWAAVMWRASWRIGKPMLELLQIPSGDQFTLAGRIHFLPALGMRLDPALLMHRVQITVKLEETVGTGDDATTSTAWEKPVIDTMLARGANAVSFQTELPSSGTFPPPPRLTQRRWVLELAALGTTTSFDLPEAHHGGTDQH